MEQEIQSIVVNYRHSAFFEHGFLQVAKPIQLPAGLTQPNHRLIEQSSCDWMMHMPLQQ
jgi:hypothetical protein